MKKMIHLELVDLFKTTIHPLYPIHSTLMPRITIGYNTTVNPRRHTYQGTFCLDSHTLYVSCTHPSELYANYGWYLGSIEIGSGLRFIRADTMAASLTQIEREQVIDCPLHELGAQLYQRINGICRDLQRQFPAKTSHLESHCLRVPAIVVGFDR